MWAPYAETPDTFESLAGTPPLAGMHAALQFPYAKVGSGSDTRFIWPEIAAPDFDWEALTDIEAEALAEMYRTDLIEGSRDQGEYWSAWSVEIDQIGSWKKIGFIWD